MLRQGDRRLRRNSRPRRGTVDDEDHRLAHLLDHLDRSAGGTQIVRARPCRDKYEIGELDDMSDRERDGGRRIDDEQVDAQPLHAFDILWQLRNDRPGEYRRIRLPLVPPIGQAALRVRVDERDRARARAFRLYRQMAR